MEFHNVTVEKASTMARYRWKRMLQRALRFFNLSVALLVFARSSWFPTTLHVFRHLYTLFVSLFNHSFFVFLLENFIILFIVLSHKNNAPNGRFKTTADSESPVDSSHHKQTIYSELVDSPVPALTETTRIRPTPTNGDKVSKSECYRRVQSESFSTRIVVGAGPELKRLNTVVRYGRELARPLGSVEKLSKEDFNRTVEDYIAKHRRMWWEEHKTEFLALTH